MARWILALLLLTSIDAHASAECLKQELGGAKKSKAQLGNEERIQVARRLEEVFRPLLEELQRESKSWSPEKIGTEIKAIQEANYISPPRRFGESADKFPHHMQEATDFGNGILSKFYVTRFNNIAKDIYPSFGDENWDRFSGRYPEFLVTLPKTEASLDLLSSNAPGKVDSLLTVSLTPVGEYGKEFSESLLMTTLIMKRMADRGLRQKARALKGLPDFEALKWEVARANALYEAPEEGPYLAVVEGILSIKQAVIELLPTKVPGVNSYQEALSKVILPDSPATSNGLLNDYVQRLSMGSVGPLTLDGRYFPQPLTASDGKVQLSEKFRLMLGSLKKRFNDRLIEDARYLHGKNRRAGQTGLGCPMAFLWKKTASAPVAPKTGIQITAESFLETFLHVDQALHGSRSRLSPR